MIELMEEKNNYGIECWTSLGEELYRKRGRGSKSLYLNAAMAMFVLSSPEKQEQFLDWVLRAERTDGGEMLPKLAKLAGVKLLEPKKTDKAPPHPTHSPIQAQTDKLLSAHPDRVVRKRKPGSPPKADQDAA